MKSHLDTECPCYCPYCDITAEREVIRSEHKEKCHKFPLTCPNNIGIDNVPHDKFDKTNKITELQVELVNAALNPSNVIELQNNINIVREEAAQSLQIARECSDKIDKQKDMMLNKQFRSYLTIAALIIAILMAIVAILVQSHYNMSELKQQIIQLQEMNAQLQEQTTQLQEQLQEQNTELQEQLQEKNTELQEQLQEQNDQLQEQNDQLQEVQQYYYQLSNSVWPIILRVSSELSNQVAPAIVKMPSFSNKLENEEVWSSSPFFAFEGGYQMCLNVYPAGNGKGEGTHVSVFLFLMKGPHDDELDQSGHWPLRGIFTVQLLNQVENSHHHSRMIEFNPYQCSKCTKRVTGIIQTQANSGWGISHFISHNTLLHNDNIYHKGDFLIFRISYEHTRTRIQFL